MLDWVGWVRGAFKTMESESLIKQRWRWGTRKRSRTETSNTDDEKLWFPNFIDDANKMLDILDAKEGKSQRRDLIINALIDDRIESLSGLFQPLDSMGQVKTRATDMTDQQLSDRVLKGACSKKFLSPKTPEREIYSSYISAASDTNEISSPKENKCEIMEEIENKYQSRREDLRGMAKLLHASRRRQTVFALEDHALHGFQREVNTAHDVVHIDRHGRLVHTRIGSLNEEEDQRPTDENRGSSRGGDDSEAKDLEDASEHFWKHYMKNPQLINDRSDADLETLQLNRPMRIRDISQQMERDARSSIQRALDRYRKEEEDLSRQQNACRENTEYELIHVPLGVPDGNNLPRISLFQRGGARPQDDEGGNFDALNNNQREQRGRNGGNWLDLRLAFRRICCAVITVAAAFICLMIQQLPWDFRDDARLEADDLWLNGFLGPHFHGHHNHLYLWGSHQQESHEVDGKTELLTVLPYDADINHQQLKEFLKEHQEDAEAFGRWCENSPDWLCKVPGELDQIML